MSRRASLPPRWLVGVVALVALAGCATSRLEDEEARRQAAVAGLGREAAQLREELAGLRAGVGELGAQVEALRRESRAAIEAAGATAARRDEAQAALSGRLAATERRVGAMAETLAGVEATVGGLDDHVARLEALASRPAPERRADRPAAPVETPRVRSPALTPEALLDRATESFRAGELGQAVLDFEEFLGKYPSHPQVTSAKFWIAEAYFRAREFAQAAAEYQKVVDAPPSDRTPEALLKLGLAHRALRREERAREAWAQLLREYADSEAAQKARAALRETLRAPTK